MYKNIVLKSILIISLFFMVGCSKLSKIQKESTATSSSVDELTLASSPVVIPKEHGILAKPNKPIYQIYYGTNRKPIDANDHSKGYSSERAEQLYTGTCKIFIPKSHKVGEIKGSLLGKILHFDSKYGDVRLQEIKNYKNKDELWSRLRELFSTIDEKEALIFIHGYNNSFEDAAIRAGQIGYDLGLKGVMAFYSWPSEDNPMKYSSDEASIQASEKYIKEFIRGFAQKSGAKKVHIIAHSMGNRGLLRAINDIQKETPNVRFGQIILAAPDVDADLFKHISKAYTKISDRTTLYVSPKDKAVWMSRIKHNHPRAGVVYPVSVIKDIDTILVNFDFSLFALGHSYFAEEDRILKDIKRLLRKNSSPSSRPKMEKMSVKNENQGSYWTLDLD